MTDPEVPEAPQELERPKWPSTFRCKVLARAVGGVAAGKTYTTGDVHEARRLVKAGLVEVRHNSRRLNDGDFVQIIEEARCG